MSSAVDAMRLLRDTSATGGWMVVRLLSLGAWLLTMARLLPATDFGWLAGALGIAAVCAMLVGAGIPYLFFADAHANVLDVLSTRWSELLGCLWVIGPFLVLLALVAIRIWMPLPVPILLVVLLLVSEVMLVGLIQSSALLLHATRNFGAASGLPATLTIGRALAAGLALMTGTDLHGYLMLHVLAIVLVTICSMAWASRRGCHLSRPRIPTRATLRQAFPFATMAGSSLATSELDKPLLGRIVGLATTGHYALAFRICTAAATPVTALSATMLPRWARMVAARSSGTLYRSFALMFAVVALSGIAGSAFLDFLIGRLPLHALGLHQEAITLLHGLVWIIAPIGLHQLAGTVLIAVGKPLLRATCDIAGLVILALLFAYSYSQQGIAGLAIACILAESMIAGLMVLVFLWVLPQGRVHGDDETN